MTFSWKPLATTFGAQVQDLDLSHPIGEADASALRALWREKGLLLFRGHRLDAAQQVALSKVFGTLEEHPAREAWVEGHPELTAIQYDPANRHNSSIYEVDGVELANWLPWHIDLIYMPKISGAGCLRALRVPDRGADTGFIDRQALHDGLPRELRARIQGRRVLYQLNPYADQQPFFPHPNVRMTQKPARIAALAARVERDFPVVSHPVDFIHPESGRTILNVSPLFSVGMDEMPQEEGDELLHDLVAHVLERGERYYHHWQVDDVVLWDNCRMLHSAEGTPVDHARRLHRTTIAGDYDLGRAARTAPSIHAGA